MRQIDSGASDGRSGAEWRHVVARRSGRDRSMARPLPLGGPGRRDRHLDDCQQLAGRVSSRPRERRSSSRRRSSATSGWTSVIGRGTEPSDRMLGGLILVDIAVLTALLMITGGPSNPFTVSYLVYITLTAVTLNATWAWGAAVASMAGYGLLFVTPLRAMSNPHAGARRHGPGAQSSNRHGRGVRGRSRAHRRFRHAHPTGPRSSASGHWPRPGARPRSRNGWPRSRRSPPARRTSWPRRSAPLPSPRASWSWRPLAPMSRPRSPRTRG